GVAVLDHRVLRFGGEVDDLFDGEGIDVDAVDHRLNGVLVVLDRSQLRLQLAKLEGARRNADQAVDDAAGAELLVLPGEFEIEQSDAARDIELQGVLGGSDEGYHDLPPDVDQLVEHLRDGG